MIHKTPIRRGQLVRFAPNGHTYRVDRRSENAAWLVGVSTQGELFMTIDEHGYPIDANSWEVEREAES
ncbi:MAG: hypothetical protein HOW73_47935 [Polyangiaceae bacterium]|nr:hypothetical protein [Polyangiaceae bacterium]